MFCLEDIYGLCNIGWKDHRFHVKRNDVNQEIKGKEREKKRIHERKGL